MANTVAVDAVGNQSNGSGATTDDNSTLTIGTGSNRALLVVVCHAGHLSGGETVVWDPSGANQSLTLIGTQAAPSGAPFPLVSLYGLVNPVSGNKVVRTSWTGADSYYVCPISFTGVDQTGGATSFAHFTRNSGNTNSHGDTVGVTVYSAVGNMVVACHVNNSWTVSDQNNTTLFLDFGNPEITGAANYADGAETVAMTVVLDADNMNWAACGVDIVAAGTAPATSVSGSASQSLGISQSAAASSYDLNWINPAPGRTPIFSDAVAATLAGTADTIIACVGDSTTKGANSSGFNFTYPHALASLLNEASFPAQAEARFGAYDGVADPQLVLGAGWTTSAASAGGPMLQNNTATNPIQLTTPIAINEFDVYYWGGDNATVDITVDGVTIDTITVALDYVMRKKTYAVAAGTHVLGFARATGPNVFFAGFSVRSAIKRIVINNIGAGGTTSGYWANNALFYPQTVLKLIQPHLTFINLGINDWGIPTDIPTYTANIQAIIDAAKATGDVILVVPVPGGNVDQAVKDTFAAALYSLALTNGLIGLDMTKRWGGSFASAQAQGFFLFDGLHPVDAGYADEAAAMSALVQYASGAEPVVTVSATASQSVGISQTAAATSAAHEQATQSLSIGQTAAAAVMVKALATQSLSVNQADAAVAPEAGQSAQSVGIIQSATAKVAIAAQAAQSVSVSQTANALLGDTIAGSSSQSVGVSQIATAQVLIAAQAAQSLTVGQSDTGVSPEVSQSSQSVSISQVATGKVRVSAQAAQSVGVQQSTGSSSQVIAEAGGSVSIVQSAAAKVAVTGSASQSLSISQDAYTVNIGSPISADQSASVGIGQVATAKVKIEAAADQSLGVSQGGEAHPVNHGIITNQSVGIGQVSIATAPASASASQSLTITGGSVGVAQIASVDSQSLSIGQDATAQVATVAKSGKNLTVNQTATAKVKIVAAADQSIGVSRGATAVEKSKAGAAQSVSIGQVATATVTERASTTQSVGISQVATAKLEARAEASQGISIAQATSSSIIVKAQADQSIGVSEGVAAKSTVTAQANQSLSIASDSAIVIDFPVDKSRASQGLSIEQSATAKLAVAASSSSSLRIKQTTSINFRILGSSNGSIGISQTAKGLTSYPPRPRTAAVAHVLAEHRVAVVLSEDRRRIV